MTDTGTGGPTQTQTLNLQPIGPLSNTHPKSKYHTVKKPRYIPIDLIIALIGLIIVFSYVLCYYYSTELWQMYNYGRNLVTNTQTRLARRLVSRKYLFSPLLNTKLYPPHYHLNAVQDKETICFKNCYQQLMYLKPISPGSTRTLLGSIQNNNNWWNPDAWALDYALKIRFQDIHYLAIRHVSISLLQQIVLWLERQVQKAYFRQEKERRLAILHEKVQETFGAMFQTGDVLMKRLHQIGVEQDQVVYPLKHLVPDDA